MVDRFADVHEYANNGYHCVRCGASVHAWEDGFAPTCALLITHVAYLKFKLRRRWATGVYAVAAWLTGSRGRYG